MLHRERPLPPGLSEGWAGRSFSNDEVDTVDIIFRYDPSAPLSRHPQADSERGARLVQTVVARGVLR